MRTTRRSLATALRAEARRDVPAPEPDFVDGLEQRLLRTPAAPAPANVLPLRRRVSRGVAIGVVAAVVSGAGAAAVAIVRSARTETPATTAPPATVESTTTAATTIAPSTTPAATAPSTAVAITVAPATTVAPIIAPPPTEPPPTEPPPTAPPVTEPPTTQAPTTAPATVPPSTEVQSPATMDISCAAGAGAVTCSWSAPPDGTDHVVLLRSTPGETRGRVLFPAPGATSFVDTTATAGLQYTYLVHALDANGHSLAHSTFATVTCCG